MADPVTINKGLIQPPNSADTGVWDQPVNNNSAAIDRVFGGLTQLNAQGASGVVMLTLAQYTPANIAITGAPGGALTYQLPLNVGGYFFINNLATGANANITFASASGGSTVTVPPGDSAAIIVDPVYGVRSADSVEQNATGPVGAVQYAGSNGNFAGDAGLTYTPATKALAVGGPLNVTGNIFMGGSFSGGLIVTCNAQTTPVAIPMGNPLAADCTTSNVFTSTLTGSTSLALNNPNDGQSINWKLTQDSVGNRTVAWPSNFRWPGGSVGVVSTVGGSIDLLVATYFASTGTWLSSLLKGFA